MKPTTDSVTSPVRASAIDKYVSWLALDQQRPKKRMFESSLEEIQNGLEEAKRREKLTAERLKRQSEESSLLRQEMENTKRMLQDLQSAIRNVITPTGPA